MGETPHATPKNYGSRFRDPVVPRFWRISNFAYQDLVRMRGLEPPRCHHHRLLRPARLPVPPHPREKRIYEAASSSVKALIFVVLQVKPSADYADYIDYGIKVWQ